MKVNQELISDEGQRIAIAQYPTISLKPGGGLLFYKDRLSK